jgi:hypothetical protein
MSSVSVEKAAEAEAEAVASEASPSRATALAAALDDISAIDGLAANTADTSWTEGSRGYPYELLTPLTSTSHLLG